MGIFNKNEGPATDPKLATIISEGCIIEGNVSGSGSIRIDGQVSGDLHMKQSVILGTKGVITGNVVTSEMILFGTLKGNVSASIVEIKATGNLTGDITTAQMTMELGGRHNGSVKMNETNTPQPAKLQEQPGA
jgi:cytoskeletal protein CcmA (bactofilin family)